MRTLLPFLLAVAVLTGCNGSGRTDDAFRATATFGADRDTYARTYGVVLVPSGTIVDTGSGIDSPDTAPTFRVEVETHGKQTSAGAPSFELHLEVEGEAPRIEPIAFDAAGESVNVIAANVICPNSWNACRKAVHVRIERVGDDSSEARFELEVRVKSSYRYRENDPYEESISIASVTIP